MACGCSKGRGAAGVAASGGGTYRVVVNGRQVYESTNPDAAAAVASRFQSAQIVKPGEPSPTA